MNTASSSGLRSNSLQNTSISSWSRRLSADRSHFCEEEEEEEVIEVMGGTVSITVRMPRAQCCASSWLWHRRSRLLRGPLKTTVKQRCTGAEPSICRNVSDWQPSRTHSTSMMETGGGEGGRNEANKEL
ncbi:hypothetical protein EYF80_039233 [Liparis tanakae]|uniref:Uncharacterized protein n=1 Tax=Liparis tanakae TaxID=230148 RepID=A0A4Z2GCD8_9TELE|nr:hypothetical protein EYF80_039233 [Liparis tanakae]